MTKIYALAALLFLPVLAHAQADFAPLEAAAKEHLINLINIDTSHPDAQETPAARYIYKVLNKHSIDWDIYRPQKRRANLAVLLPAAQAAKAAPQKALLMLAHLDSAPVQEEWATPPTTAVVKDGRIYGLGATDAKNYAAVNLAILTWLKDNNVKLNRDVIFLFTADEEAGSGLGLKYLYDKYPPLRSAGYALNEGGGFIDEETGLKNIMFVEAASKMYMDILVTAAGEGGHSASSGEEANAIYKLSEALSKIEAHQMPLKTTPFTLNFFERISHLQDADAKTTVDIFLHSPGAAQRAQAARIISEDSFFKTQLFDTITPTAITAGQQPGTLEAAAHATLNCRLLPSTNPQDFFARLQALFEGDDSITLTIAEQPELPFPQPPARSDDALFKAIEKSVEQLHPGALTLPGLSPAAGESEFLRRHGVIAYGIGPVMEAATGPHQANESISEAALYDQLKLTLSIILNFAQIN